jgi:hypothetical protein
MIVYWCKFTMPSDDLEKLMNIVLRIPNMYYSLHVYSILMLR